MDSVYPETRNMVRVLTQKLIETKDKSFTGQGQSGRVKSCCIKPNLIMLWLYTESDSSVAPWRYHTIFCSILSPTVV
jgi:hypothetical protein